ncbi:MAG: leucine-rich repeat protein [Lachnospiraceae bacterium]|nr:leucine-rich repeat protein [Lachnospiraceae bacterium]
MNKNNGYKNGFKNVKNSFFYKGLSLTEDIALRKDTLLNNDIQLNKLKSKGFYKRLAVILTLSLGIAGISPAFSSAANIDLGSEAKSDTESGDGNIENTQNSDILASKDISTPETLNSKASEDISTPEILNSKASEGISTPEILNSKASEDIINSELGEEYSGEYDAVTLKMDGTIVSETVTGEKEYTYYLGEESGYDEEIINYMDERTGAGSKYNATESDNNSETVESENDSETAESGNNSETMESDNKSGASNSTNINSENSEKNIESTEESNQKNNKSNILKNTDEEDDKDTASQSAIEENNTASQSAVEENKYHKLFVDTSDQWGFDEIKTEYAATQKLELYKRGIEVFENILFYEDDFYLISKYGNNNSSGRGYYGGRVRYSDLALDGDDLVHVMDFIRLDTPFIYCFDSAFYDNDYYYIFVTKPYATAEKRFGLADYIYDYLENMQTYILENPDLFDSNYDILKYVHDQMIKHVNYDYDHITETETHNITGYFRDYYGLDPLFVCDGYSYTAQLILNYLDVFCVITGGSGTSKERAKYASSGHAWNVVKIGNGEYYYMDVTWDDNVSGQDYGTNRIVYTYFLKGTTFFDKNHYSYRTNNDGHRYADPPVGKDDYDYSDGETDGRIVEPDPTYEIPDYEENYFEYVLSGDILFINGTGTIRTEDDYMKNPWYKFKDEIVSIKIGEGITGIGNGAFRNCYNLEEIEFPESMVTIGAYAFYNCNSLKNVMLTDNITCLSKYSFAECDELRSVSIGKMEKAKIAQYDSKISRYAFDNSLKLESITVDPENPVLKAVDSVLFTKDGTELIMYPVSKQDTSYTVPDGVTILNNECMLGNKYLEELTLCDGIEYYGNSAVAFCDSLKTVNFGDPGTEYVTYKDSFLYATAIDTITVPEDASFFEMKDGVLFTESGKFLSYYTFSNTAKEYVIPDGTERLCVFCFDSVSSIEKVVIPNTVRRIDMEAFFYCYNLSEVIIGNGVSTLSDSAFWGSENILRLENNSYCNLKLKQFGYKYRSGKGAYNYWKDEETGRFIDHISKGTALLTQLSLPMGIGIVFYVDGIEYTMDAYSDWVLNDERKLSNKTTWQFTLDELNSGEPFGVVIGNFDDEDDTIDVNNVSYDGWTYSVKRTLKMKLLEENVLKIYGDGIIEKRSFGHDLNDYQKNVAKVIISNGIDGIGEYAFEGFEAVTEIEIGSGVQSIGKGAFNDMKELVFLNIPSTVKEISDEEIIMGTDKLSLIFNNSDSSIKLLVTSDYSHKAPMVKYWRSFDTETNKCEAEISNGVVFAKYIDAVKLLGERFDYNGYTYMLNMYVSTEWRVFVQSMEAGLDVSTDPNEYNILDSIANVSIIDYADDYVDGMEIPDINTCLYINDWKYKLVNVALPAEKPTDTEDTQVPAQTEEASADSTEEAADSTEEPDVTNAPESTEGSGYIPVPRRTITPDYIEETPGVTYSPRRTITPDSTASSEETLKPADVGASPEVSKGPEGTDGNGSTPGSSISPDGKDGSGSSPEGSANPDGKDGSGNSPEGSAGPEGTDGNGSTPGSSTSPDGKDGSGNMPGSSTSPGGKDGSGNMPGSSASPDGKDGSGNSPEGSAGPDAESSLKPADGNDSENASRGSIVNPSDNKDSETDNSSGSAIDATEDDNIGKDKSENNNSGDNGWNNPVITPAPGYIYTPKPTVVAATEEAVEKGSYITIDDMHLKILKAADSNEDGKVSITGMDGNKDTINIPDTVIIAGATYKIVKIGKKAFKNNKNVDTLIIGKYVKQIGKQAFYGCRKLEYIKICSKKIKSVGKNAFKGINKNAIIKAKKSIKKKIKL